jgi:MFS family permease
MTTLAITFVRDRFTWLAYLMLAYFAYLQAGLGPLMPFLGEELDLNYTVRALHLSAFALGMILAGLTGDAAARRFGRRLVFWGGGAGMALGALLLILVRHPALTIASSFAMGFIGSYLLVMVQATLSDRHLTRRATALTEANVAAAISAGLAPILISQTEGVGIGWRAALFIGAGVWVLLALFFQREHIPERDAAPRTTVDQSGQLPRTFWIYWLVIVLGVAIEWCMIFWGADFLYNVVGMSKVNASGAMAVFFAAMVIGRAAGSRLTLIFPTSRLLLAAILTVLVGFPLFWLAQAPILNLLGLFFVGLGVANLFPLTLSAASGIAAANANKASARISLAAGVAILVAPQVLGSTADQIGIFNAFGIAGALAVAVLILTVTANRAASS